MSPHNLHVRSGWGGKGTAAVLGVVILTAGGALQARAQSSFATAGNGVVTSHNGVASSSTVSVFYDRTTVGNMAISTPGLSAFTSSTYIGGTSQASGAGYSGSVYAGTTDLASYIKPVSSTGTGFFDYRFTFTGSAGAALAGHALGDNEIQSAYIDGALTTLTSAKGNGYPVGGYANEPSAANFSGLLGTGSTHTFDIILYNHDGPTNIAFEASTVHPVPECGLLINGASMLGMTGLGLIRLRGKAKKGKTAA